MTRSTFPLQMATFFATLCLAQEIEAQAVLNPNQIRGTIRFSNTNPDIIAILNRPQDNPPGLSQGFLNPTIRAVRLGLSQATTTGVIVSGTQVDYELTVESDPAGLTYEVSCFTALDIDSGDFDTYIFEAQTSPPVFPEPAPDVVVDLEECVGIFDIRFVDALGAPVTVRGGTVALARETSPGSGTFTALPFPARIRRGDAGEYVAIRGDGTHYRLDITYSLEVNGTDTVNLFHQTFATAVCDQIVRLDVPVGTVGALGEIIGTVDMVGETEHAIANRTRIRAQDGPFDNLRQRILTVGTPSQGSFVLPNLLPSDAVSPALGYRVWADMLFRSGRRFEYFRTPHFGDNQNGRVQVQAGSATDLADAFVIQPGLARGTISLLGPPPGVHGSCLEHLVRDSDPEFDTDGNGIPDRFEPGNEFVFLANSNVHVDGRDLLATGAAHTAHLGFAQAIFEGEYQPATHRFEGDYELVLGGLHGERSLWTPPELRRLTFVNDTPLNPEAYLNCAVHSISPITVAQTPPIEIVPGQTTEHDLSYCFSEVVIEFRSLAGTFHDPRISTAGQFVGTDPAGNPVDYRVGVGASGTPVGSSNPSNQGLVRLCLPEGTYVVFPIVTSVDPGGGTSTTQLPRFDLQVGCRQIIRVTTELQLHLDPVPEWTHVSTLGITGNVESDGNVERIYVTVNGGPEIDVCSSCGVDPSFAFNASLQPCVNEITVTAVDSFGNEASVTEFVTLDATPPLLSGCDDVVVRATPGQTSALVSYAVSATDDCPGPVEVTCVPPSGSLFPEGASWVTCTARDASGNENQCQFLVTVLTNEPPTCTADFTAADAAFLQPSPGSWVITEGETLVVAFTGEDPDGDDLTASVSGLPAGAALSVGSGSAPLATELTWTPAAADKTGAPYLVEVTFTDPSGEGATCQFVVEDVNLRPQCDSGGGPTHELSLECTSPAGAPVTLQGSATDADDPLANLTYHWDVSDVRVTLNDPDIASPSGTFPIGVTMATLTVADGRGGVSTCDVTVTVRDTTPPEVKCTTDYAVLWPPNHKMETVRIVVIGTDECSSPSSIVPLTVTVRSDEPDNATGVGDGNTTGDVHGQDGYTSPVDITPLFSFDPSIGTEGAWVATIELRAEREGTADGRKYTIDVQASDSQQNVAETSCCIVVPHDRRGR